MSVITLFSGTYCQTTEFRQAIVQASGFSHISEEKLLSAAAQRSGLTVEKLATAFSSKASIFNKFTHERERSLAYIKLTLATFLREENILLDGQSLFLVPTSISHILKICLIADMKSRTNRAMQKRVQSEKESIKAITADDLELVHWLKTIGDCHDPWASSWYDIIIPTDKLSPEKAGELVHVSINRDILRPTDQSMSAVDDFELAAQVEVALSREGHDVRVSAEQGHITLTINKHVLMLSRLEDELRGIAGAIDRVTSVTTRVGKEFHQADIYRKQDFAMPSKVLLVDDEREFVQTLSERLEMRDMGSAVAYDGESALEIVSRDEPEVMILDLKMPGIDGIEVLKRVKSTRPDIEIIILTGHGSDKDREICMEYGAFAYLQKPVDIDLLSRTLKEANQKIKKNKDKGATL